MSLDKLIDHKTSRKCINTGLDWTGLLDSRKDHCAYIYQQCKRYTSLVVKRTLHVVSEVIKEMEDYNSPQREGDCPFFPILITDSPEVNSGRLFGHVHHSPFKTDSDQGQKDSFRLVYK